MPTTRTLARRLAAPATAALTTVVVVGTLLPACSRHSQYTSGQAAAQQQQPPAGGQPLRVLHPAPAPGKQVGGEPGNVYTGTEAGKWSPAVAGVPERVYVPNSDGRSVDVIDPATFTVIDRFRVGRTPEHVTPSWDLKSLYVDNTDGDTLTPIDPRTGKPGTPIPVTDPYNLYFTPDGSRAIVVAERFRRLDFRDPHTWQVVGSLPIPRAGADHLDFSLDGRFFLITAEFSGYVLKVDTERMRVVSELYVGGSPIDVKLSPDGSVFYVANQRRNGVSVIDAAQMRELAFVPTGKGAHGLYVSRDTRSLYVTNRGGGGVSVIDLATRSLRTTWPFLGSPDMGGVSPDGSQLWLSGRYNREVYVLDTTTGKLLHRIAVGRGPHGLCLFPQPGQFSMGHTGVYR